MKMSAASDDTPKKQNKIKKVDRNDPARFAEPGLSYKGKLIGVEDVPEPRGDKMCQVAMAKLKAAVKTIGDHKQKIIISVSLDGVKISDEKTESVVHFHPVHRISFISRDIGDSRAFGYVYGTGNGSHQFYGIKTEKVAEGIVMSLRDLFQVVFEMKQRTSEIRKRSVDSEDRFREQQLYASQRSTSGGRAWQKYDHWSQSVGLTQPYASQHYLTMTPPASLRMGITRTMDRSPVMVSRYGHLSQRQTRGGLSFDGFKQEPTYQNTGLVSSSFVRPSQNSQNLHSNASPVPTTHGTSLAMPKKSTAKLTREKDWVSFDFGSTGKSFSLFNEDDRRMTKTDPFADDPFFNRTPGSSGSESAIWQEESIEHRRAVDDPNSRISAGAENESEKFADFSKFGISEIEISSDNAAWMPSAATSENQIGGCKQERCSKNVVETKEEKSCDVGSASDKESLSDLVSFPSPDAPPPPLPDNVVLPLDHQPPPAPPRRPELGSSKAVGEAFEVSFLNEFDVMSSSSVAEPPALPPRHLVDELPPPSPRSTPIAATTSASGTPVLSMNECEDVVPPLPPPRARLRDGEVSASNRSTNDFLDPFVFSLQQKSSKTSSSVVWSSDHSLGEGAPTFEKQFTVNDEESIDRRVSSCESSPQLPLTTRQRPDWSSADHVTLSSFDGHFQESTSVGIQSALNDVPDPFQHLDPFAAIRDVRVDPFASTSSKVPSLSTAGCITLEPFRKCLSAESQSFRTVAVVTADSASDVFEDVFSSKDESDDKTEDDNSNRSSTGGGGGLDGRLSAIKDDEFGGCVSSGFNSAASLNASKYQNTSDGGTCLDGSNCNRAEGGGESGGCRNATEEEIKRGTKQSAQFQHQSSFDSIMDDFVRRFPPFDDNWITLGRENSKSPQLRSNETTTGGSLQPVAGGNGKSCLVAPKSSDSSSNSEIADAFGDDFVYSSSKMHSLSGKS